MTPFKQLQVIFEQYLQQSLPNTHPLVQPLVEAVHYSLLDQGKRLRPLLVLCTVEAFQQPLKLGLASAAAIECIHCYSLIHDDLPCLDNSALRHGKPTNHKRYGEAVALLAGDALLTEAFALAANANPELSANQQLKIVHQLAIKSGLLGMVGGQYADIHPPKTTTEPESTDWAKFVHEHKTAALISCCLQVGGIVAGASLEQQQLLGQLGQQLGLAYQIQDDMLDYTSEEQVLGKPVGQDMQNMRFNYLNSWGLQQTQEFTAQTFNKALTILPKLNADVQVLTEIIHKIQNRSF